MEIHGLRQGPPRLGIAVDEKASARFQALHQARQFAPVRVCRKRVGLHLARHAHALAVEGEDALVRCFCPHQIQQRAARGFFILIPRNRDQIRRIARQPLGVITRRAADQHPRRRHDATRRPGQNAPPISGGSHRAYGPGIKNLLIAFDSAAHLRRKIIAKRRIHRIDRPHHAIDKHGKFGDLLAPHGPCQNQNDLLGTPHRKRGNQHFATGFNRFGYAQSKRGFLLGAVRVLAVAISRFHHHHPGPTLRDDHPRNGQLIGDRHIAGHQNALAHALDIDHRRAQDVPRRNPGGGQRAIANRHGGQPRHVHHAPECRIGCFGRIEGQLAVSFPASRHQLHRVGQQHARNGLCRRRGIHVHTGGQHAFQCGQCPRVIGMCVRHQHGFGHADVVQDRKVGQLRSLRGAHPNARIHQNATAFDLD